MDKWTTLPEVEQDPHKVSGAWVFRGTRVPVSALFENLRDGATVEEFLEWFPGVTREQVERFIALIQREPFDYTEWQRNLWPTQSIEELSQAAMQQRQTTLPHT
jgi:uncharacterized protein (DUF433 family)